MDRCGQNIPPTVVVGPAQVRTNSSTLSLDQVSARTAPSSPITIARPLPSAVIVRDLSSSLPVEGLRLVAPCNPIRQRSHSEAQSPIPVRS